MKIKSTCKRETQVMQRASHAPKLLIVKNNFDVLRALAEMWGGHFLSIELQLSQNQNRNCTLVVFFFSVCIALRTQRNINVSYAQSKDMYTNIIYVDSYSTCSCVQCQYHKYAWLFYETGLLLYYFAANITKIQRNHFWAKCKVRGLETTHCRADPPLSQKIS
jgi:hypothetical protein